MTARPQKITFAEMRDMGVRRPDLLRGLSQQPFDRDQRRAMTRTSCASIVMLPPLAKPVRKRIRSPDGPPVRAEIRAALPAT